MQLRIEADTVLLLRRYSATVAYIQCYCCVATTLLRIEGSCCIAAVA